MITLVAQLRAHHDETERTFTDLDATIAAADRAETAGGRAEIVHPAGCGCRLCATEVPA